MFSTSGSIWVNGNATTTGAGNFSTLGTIVASSTLQVTGATTLFSTLNVTGATALASTLDVTGKTTLANASTTMLSSTGNVWVNGFATTTASNGDIATQGALTVNGVSTLTGNAILTTASSTGLVKVESLKVASAGSTVSGLVFGACNVADTAITASTTAFADCTGATGILANDRVFVMATSSLPGDFIIQAASSSVAATINLRIYNSGVTGQTTTGARTLNFIGIR